MKRQRVLPRNAVVPSYPPPVSLAVHKCGQRLTLFRKMLLCVKCSPEVAAAFPNRESRRRFS